MFSIFKMSPKSSIQNLTCPCRCPTPYRGRDKPTTSQFAPNNAYAELKLHYARVHHSRHRAHFAVLKSKLKRTQLRNGFVVGSDEMEAGGSDSDGREFKSAEEMWREEMGEGDLKKTEWYQKGVGYWEGVEASVDGVLGGYGHVNEADVKGSEAFLKTLLGEKFFDGGKSQHLVALDCGSGIGRVTKNLLIRYFNEVDLLEPVSHFLDAARKNLDSENLMVSTTHRAMNFFCIPLQEFTPDAGRYDVIWIQWCIGHLADDDFVSFFNRAKTGLKPGGFFILKENIARSGFVLDKEDRSITRSDLYFKELFSRCGLHIIKSKDQREFPQELFAVKMYALTPEMPKRVIGTRSKVQANRPGIIK